MIISVIDSYGYEYIYGRLSNAINLISRELLNHIMYEGMLFMDNSLFKHFEGIKL